MDNDKQILEGKIGKAILSFFFPILLGTFFQQLYNTVDAVIVGRFAGKTALSSVGGSSAILVNLVVGFFTGLSSGCTVLVANYFGSGEKKKLEEVLHTTYAFGILGGVSLGGLMVYLVPELLRLMKTDPELMGESTTYLRVYFAGLLFVFIYNLGAGILRALGDSRRPLIYLIICTGVNIVFDLLFVLGLRKGVFGVALATLIAQGISSVLVTLRLIRGASGVVLTLRRIRIVPSSLLRILKIGLPAGIQSSCYAISNLFIQTAINTFGVNTIAGWTAEGKVDCIFWMINASFGVAATTFVGQNYGAGKRERVRKGTRVCLLMSVSSALLVSTVLYTAGGFILRLFTKDPDVLSIGTGMLRYIVPFYVFFAFIEIFSSALRARGDTFFPTVINLTAIVGFRLVWIRHFFGTTDIYRILRCYPLSWILCAVLMTLYYLGYTFLEKRHQERSGKYITES